MEHILLDDNSHKNDNYLYEKITSWLNTLLSVNFLGKDIIIKQLFGASYEVHGKHEYISIKFNPNKCEPYPYNIRVPISMQCRQFNGNIVDCLLHVINGFVNELEIYNMDLTDFDAGFSLDNLIYRIDEEIDLTE